jgi:hypothetical protein
MEDKTVIATKFLLPLRPNVAPLVEYDDKNEKCKKFVSLKSNKFTTNEALMHAASSLFWEQPFDIAKWQHTISSLIKIFHSEGLIFIVLYETIAEYLRTVLLDEADEYKVSLHCDRWLLMYKHVLEAAVAHPGMFHFRQLQDVVATAGAYEMSLNDAKTLASEHFTDYRSEKGTSPPQLANEAVFRELKPATSTSLGEVEALMHRQIPKETFNQITRIETCCRRAVYNCRALALSQDLRYSNAVVRTLRLDLGRDSDTSNGVIIKNPAFFGGKPILEFDGRRWLAHAPPPEAGASEYIFPFLLLSGQYRLFMNIIGRDRRSQPLNITVRLIDNKTGQPLKQWTEFTHDGRNIFLNKSFMAIGEYHLSISISVDEGSPNNHFSAVWIGDASLIQTDTESLTN